MEKLKTASGAFCFASCKKRVFAFLFFNAISLPCIFSNCLKREIPLCSFSFLSIYYYRKDFSFDSHIYVPLLLYSCSIIIGHNVYSTVTIHFHSIYIYIYILVSLVREQLQLGILWSYIYLQFTSRARLAMVNSPPLFIIIIIIIIIIVIVMI